MAGKWSFSDSSGQLWVLLYAIPTLYRNQSFLGSGAELLCWEAMAAYGQPGEGALATRLEAMVTMSICGSLDLVAIASSADKTGGWRSESTKQARTWTQEPGLPPAWLCHFLRWLGWKTLDSLPKHLFSLL